MESRFSGFWMTEVDHAAVAQMDPERSRKSMEFARWHDEWQQKHGLDDADWTPEGAEGDNRRSPTVEQLWDTSERLARFWDRTRTPVSDRTGPLAPLSGSSWKIPSSLSQLERIVLEFHARYHRTRSDRGFLAAYEGIFGLPASEVNISASVLSMS